MTRYGSAYLLPLLLISCRTQATPAPFSVSRPPGERHYRFASTQRTPAGSSRVQVDFTLQTSANGKEVARLTDYRRAVGAGALVPGRIEPACVERLAAPAGAIAVLPITPPPELMGNLIADCVPEDLFGAASDILPILMIQVQPKFRAAELRRVGERLRFPGYRTGWRLPPGLLDAVITADSGVVSLDSLSPSRRVIGWNSSPMRVGIVRQLGPGQRALLQGQEWFSARIEIDRDGVLLRGWTTVDSLALRLITPYPDSVVPPDQEKWKDAGSPVTVTRVLELTLLLQ